ncbi:hypothetical protein PybrP1_002721 [[Pythium] brassicae (nom. inval.)]|nr:hypothetical protein PybrP1_002721 [[Pythium] brassicae (nom. inval.)]
MAPPVIETNGRHFRDEVVIDGESSSTDSEDEVMVITPQSRKRKRAAAVVEEDEDDVDSGSNEETKQADDGDDDDVEIVQIGATATPLDGSASKKSRRLTIQESQDSEDEHEPVVARPTRRSESTPNRRHSTGDIYNTPATRAAPGSSTSSSRRSSRIEHKRQEKVSEPSAVRKLELVSLDNCLETIASRRPSDRGSADDDDFDDDEEEEDDEAPSDTRRRRGKAPARRRRPPPRETEREVLHADGDDDLDEFIVGDNEVEYMDDDENGVISIESGSEGGGGDDDDELNEYVALRAAQQTRDPKQWFAIYLEYLEESILDAELDKKMRRRSSNGNYQLYREAIHHIERTICSRRDNLRGNVVWPPEMLDALRRASYFRSSRCSGERECEACNRQNHIATYYAQLGGVACDATELYREGWMEKLRKSTLVGKTVHAKFEMGSVCHARTLAYWQLLHAKRFWVILVDATMKANRDVTGRISVQYRNALASSEYGRYKRLLHLVDKFETEARHSSAFMPNVWKKVTPQHVTSDFLSTARFSGGADEARRGSMDAFVAESEDEDEDEDEEEEEEDNDDEEVAEEEAKLLKLNDVVEPDGRPKPSGNGVALARTPPVAAGPSAVVKSESSSATQQDEPDAEDLRCLVCGENPRNGGIMHGQYLHFYCCFRCGKRQHRAGMGCLVCDRPIDKVLRLLPLTSGMRQAIQENNQ